MQNCTSAQYGKPCTYSGKTNPQKAVITGIFFYLSGIHVSLLRDTEIRLAET